MPLMSITYPKRNTGMDDEGSSNGKTLGFGPSHEGSSPSPSAELGMPYGTASARLKKRVFMMLLEQLGRADCYRCGKSMNAATLSIEHKQPWRGVSADLFWNLDNITFSHIACNKTDRPSRAGGGNKRPEGPDGTAWCSGHQVFHPVDDFYPAKTGWMGLSNVCKPLERERRNAARRNKYKSDPEHRQRRQQSALNAYRKRTI